MAFQNNMIFESAYECVHIYMQAQNDIKLDGKQSWRCDF